MSNRSHTISIQLLPYQLHLSIVQKNRIIIYIGRGALYSVSLYWFRISPSLMGQLVGIRFRRIFLLRNRLHNSLDCHYGTFFQKYSRPIRILNILRTLHLQCEEIHCMEDTRGMPWNIMRLIRFTSIYAKRSTCTAQMFFEIKQRRIDVFRGRRLTISVHDYDTTFRNFRAVSIKKLEPEPWHSIFVRYLGKIIETKDHGRLKKLSIPFNINNVGLLDDFPWKQIYRTPVGPLPWPQTRRNNCLVLLTNLSEDKVILIISKETMDSMNQTAARCKISFTRNDKIKVTRKVLHSFLKDCDEEDKELVQKTIRTIASKEWEDQQDFYQQLLEKLKYEFYF